MSDSDEETAEKQLKFVLVGANGVGKTSIITRYVHDSFSRHYQVTVGVDFFLKRTILSSGRSVVLQLWDVGGQSLAGKMLDKYVYGAHAVLLVYDATSASSFENLEDWLDAVKQVVISQDQSPVLALIANKGDLEHLRAVRLDKHQKFAQENSLSGHMMSAKTGESVALTFQKIAAEILGIRMTRAEQEQHQPIVRAEIVNYPTEQLPRASVTGPGYPKTAVCTIQ